MSGIEGQSHGEAPAAVAASLARCVGPRAAGGDSVPSLVDLCVSPLSKPEYDDNKRRPHRSRRFLR